MYRVVTSYRNGTARPIVEKGPWHEQQHLANSWADTLRALGYHTKIESQASHHDTDDRAALANALSSMA